MSSIGCKKCRKVVKPNDIFIIFLQNRDEAVEKWLDKRSKSKFDILNGGDRVHGLKWSGFASENVLFIFLRDKYHKDGSIWLIK